MDALENRDGNQGFPVPRNVGTRCDTNEHFVIDALPQIKSACLISISLISISPYDIRGRCIYMYLQTRGKLPNLPFHFVSWRGLVRMGISASLPFLSGMKDIELRISALGFLAGGKGGGGGGGVLLCLVLGRVR